MRTVNSITMEEQVKIEDESTETVPAEAAPEVVEESVAETEATAEGAETTVEVAE